MRLTNGIQFILSRDIEIVGAKKVLMEGEFGYMLIIAVMVCHLVINAEMEEGKPPIFMLVIFSV